ncbi:hypothetical protein N7540_002654 [Penicillium herquei]|nr:hypothetical protein N7540_002654 [Penicillium herquei]
MARVVMVAWKAWCVLLCEHAHVVGLMPGKLEAALEMLSRSNGVEESFRGDEEDVQVLSA